MGNVRAWREEQPEKAPFPMLVTVAGIVTEVKLVQPRNASDPMPVTLAGIVTEVSPVQPRKAESAMLVTPAGMTNAPVTSLPSIVRVRPLATRFASPVMPHQPAMPPV